MRILFLLQDIPYPPDNGTRNKVYNIISYVSHGHEIHIISFGDRYASERAKQLCKISPNIKILKILPYNAGVRLVIKQFAKLLKLYPIFLARYESKFLRSFLNNDSLMKSYDIVHFDTVGLSQYIKDVKNVATVFSPHDATSWSVLRRAMVESPLLRLILMTYARLIRKYEKYVYPLFNYVHVVSPVDYDYMKENVYPALNLRVIGLSVDDSVINYKCSSGLQKKEGQMLVFSGNLKYQSISTGLLQFLEYCYGAITEAVPGVKMVILGRDIPAEIEKKLCAFAGIDIIKWVDDYNLAVSAADICIFPDKAGTGIKTRVLTAMALGKPAVCSQIAIEGIPVENGKHCFVCKNSDEYVNIIVKLLQDPVLRNTIGETARQFISNNYTQQIIGRTWESLYISCLSTRSAEYEA